MFVAAAFQDMKKPAVDMMKPCKNIVDGLVGKDRKRIAAIGIADAELIWDKIIRPEFGRRLERISPILPQTDPQENYQLQKSP